MEAGSVVVYMLSRDGEVMNRKLKRFISEIKEAGSPKDLHVTRFCSSLVAISNGKVIKTTKPTLRYCPLVSSLYGFQEETDLDSLKAMIVEAVEWKIKQFGMFTDLRRLHRNSIAIPFGASEMIMYHLKKGRADSAVTVCDGAGTVIADNPYLVQGIGARMNGVFYTSPINKVISEIREMGGEVPFPETARIDQAAGVRRALKKHKCVDVTVSGLGDDNLKEIREIEAEHGATVSLLAVCTTGVGQGRVEEIGRYADLVWSCASGKIREIIGKEAELQIATKIPVYALTEKALEFVSSYSNGLTGYIQKFEGPYIVSGKCKQLPDVFDCKKIEMGDFETYIGRTKELPIRSGKEPKPLL
jgi:putative methanogenesis marker protein 8